MSSAICFNLDKFEILSSGKELRFNQVKSAMVDITLLDGELPHSLPNDKFLDWSN